MFANRIAWRIFIGAVAIRWAYALIIYGSMGTNGLLGPDSVGYLGWIETFLANLKAGSLHGWQLLSPELSLMPLVPWLWVGNVAIFGAFGVLAFVLLQGLIDAGTCLLIHGSAKSFDDRFAVPAAVAAIFNPTQIVMSGLFYTDILFLFFAALILFASLRWMREESWSSALLIGLGLGGAALSRILIVPWVIFLFVFLLAMAVIRSSLSLRALKQLAVAGTMLALCVAPILARNVTQYGAWALTPQTGAHYALWIAPLVRQAKDGTLWTEGSVEIQKRIDEKIGRSSDNPFEVSHLYGEIGMQALRELGAAAVIKAWLYGAAINFGSPAATLSPPVLHLPHTGFYGTPGASMLDKIVAFLFQSDNTLYAWILLIGILGVTLVRFIQLCGLIVMMRNGTHWPGLLLMGAWIGFILAVNGPIASPKYRLPMEPPLMVITGAGFCALRGWRERRRS